MEKFYEDIDKKLKQLQAIASEWRPDEEETFEEEEERELRGHIDFVLTGHGDEELKKATRSISYLIGFCWDWFPEEWDKDELEEYKEKIEEATTLLEKIKNKK